jgi:hypothetical protein
MAMVLYERRRQPLETEGKPFTGNLPSPILMGLRLSITETMLSILVRYNNLI